ncbi:uncharacterized protein LOC105702809 [Orussus abietinus]|uniref:uncharacterized protein LOC105702809 n=1 Tax=Orussus abietinus TaxID=222816 RepID=UPI00062546CC|nr:uncharacterized protein LOC105702809 [Orussus abietinus]XP_012286087.1 uncharacterized protein LOC105702809 [Orussus abietinus]XP_012286089.1 uncharacterized protein LOC105702809 [Orussus abietinus]
MAKKSGPICQAKATRCLKVPLKSTEQIYLVFLIPTLLSCIIYIVHFSSDLVVAIQHFREEHSAWGCYTIGLMYAPAIAYFGLTVSRPDWWMTEDDKLSKGVVQWFLLQLCHLIAFPLFALYRYAGQIVLAIDAILLSGQERTKTLNVAAVPAAIELYFFLQAWFQAAPQAVLQTHLLFRQEHIIRSAQSVTVHVLCIFMSILALSIQTMSFQRFESQRVNGRKVPWAMWLNKYRTQDFGSLGEKKPLQSTVLPEEKSTTEQTTSEQNVETDSKEDLLPDRPSNPLYQNLTDGVPVLERQISTTPPLPPRNVQVTPPPAPLRGITTVTPLPIPEMPAPPRPDSALISPESKYLSKGALLPAEPSESQYERSPSLRVPTRVYTTKGLEEDDPIGKFLGILWWWFFIAPRIFSIAVFYEFYPEYLLIIVGLHYVIMLAYLFYYSKDYCVTTVAINLWLGMVYIFGIIEYKVKFKYADRWIISYYVFMMLQNTFLSLIWYFYAEWDSYWYAYIFFATFASMGLCIMCTVVYYVLLKPKKHRVYAS